ncbi:hypothetical protein MMC10_001630 [Thelotrema lepadinum]|nr:hypothetical protein [Thelotrema lepadinum]
MAAEESKSGTSETATKAASESAFPNDSPAQAGASMGDHCVTDRETPSGEAPTGEISKIADVDVYISKPSDYPHAPSKLLLFLSSGTGIHSVNNQIQADRFASEGFLVVMPDQFGGDSAPNTRPSDLEENPTVIEQVKLRAAETVKSFVVDMWLARQTPEKVLPILQRFIAGAREEFADAVANGDGIYAVGYCFGAKYVLLLGAELPDTEAHGQTSNEGEEGVVKKGPAIKVGAIAHGTMIQERDFEKLKAPVSIVYVEGDPLFPDDVKEAGKKHLEQNQVQHELRTYPGVPHGFAVVGEYQDTMIKESQATAFEQMAGWLTSH